MSPKTLGSNPQLIASVDNPERSAILATVAPPSITDEICPPEREENTLGGGVYIKRLLKVIYDGMDVDRDR